MAVLSEAAHNGAESWSVLVSNGLVYTLCSRVLDLPPLANVLKHLPTDLRQQVEASVSFYLPCWLYAAINVGSLGFITFISAAWSAVEGGEPNEDNSVASKHCAVQHHEGVLAAHNPPREWFLPVSQHSRADLLSKIWTEPSQTFNLVHIHAEERLLIAEIFSTLASREPSFLRY